VAASAERGVSFASAPIVPPPVPAAVVPPNFAAIPVAAAQGSVNAVPSPVGASAERGVSSAPAPIVPTPVPAAVVPPNLAAVAVAAAQGSVSAVPSPVAASAERGVSFAPAPIVPPPVPAAVVPPNFAAIPVAAAQGSVNAVPSPVGASAERGVSFAPAPIVPTPVSAAVVPPKFAAAAAAQGSVSAVPSPVAASAERGDSSAPAPIVPPPVRAAVVPPNFTAIPASTESAVAVAGPEFGVGGTLRRSAFEHSRAAVVPPNRVAAAVAMQGSTEAFNAAIVAERFAREVPALATPMAVSAAAAASVPPSFSTPFPSRLSVSWSEQDDNDRSAHDGARDTNPSSEGGRMSVEDFSPDTTDRETNPAPSEAGEEASYEGSGGDSEGDDVGSGGDDETCHMDEKSPAIAPATKVVDKKTALRCLPDATLGHTIGWHKYVDHMDKPKDQKFAFLAAFTRDKDAVYHTLNKKGLWEKVKGPVSHAGAYEKLGDVAFNVRAVTTFLEPHLNSSVLNREESHEVLRNANQSMGTLCKDVAPICHTLRSLAKVLCQDSYVAGIYPSLIAEKAKVNQLLTKLRDKNFQLTYIQAVAGLDWVGDELGHPFCIFSHDSYVSLVAEWMGHEPNFGVRIHAGEGPIRPSTTHGSESKLRLAFYLHMYILTEGIMLYHAKLTAKLREKGLSHLKPRIRIGHGVAFLWGSVSKDGNNKDGNNKDGNNKDGNNKDGNNKDSDDEDSDSEDSDSEDSDSEDSDSEDSDSEDSDKTGIDNTESKHWFDVHMKEFRCFLRDNEIVCELSPTSNHMLLPSTFHTGDRIANRRTLRCFLDEQLPVVLSTDDDGIWAIHKCKCHYRHISVAAEYCRAIECGDIGTESELQEMLWWGRYSAFCRPGKSGYGKVPATVQKRRDALQERRDAAAVKMTGNQA
jgi:adenosine deaminase